MSDLHDVTAVVTIGRNVEETPLDDVNWRNFRHDLFLTIRRNGGDVFARPDATRQSGHFGTYGDVIEDTAFVAFTLNSDNLPLLRHQLAVLANEYAQEAIGLIVQTDPGTLVFASDRLGPIE